MKILGALCLSALFLTASAHSQKLTITQLKNGKSIEVEPIELKDDSIRFHYNGREFNFPMEQLTAESRQGVEGWHQQQTAAGQELDGTLNKAIGLPLFAEAKNLWDEPAGDVASRLGWPAESVGESSSSYRKYTTGSELFLGARPYCCTLYGHSQKRTESLSLVFANKGDFNSMLGFGEDHFKKVEGTEKKEMTLNDAIARDATTISDKLTKILGEPTEQRYGEKEDRRDVLRWDHRGHSFILSQRENEYTHLLIVDKPTADRGGKVEFIKDSDFKEMLQANIKKEDNGDVRITNIPMVNQGPKGYCAPATFERAMRYMQVPADMYLLATLATTAGGGTQTGLLAEEAKRIISSKARRIKDLDLEKDLDVRLVKRYIDKGVPILWQMASVPAYNEAANNFTRKRSTATDFEEWSKEIADKTEELLPMLSNESNYHICLIIGYNEETSEIAVSDSWGPSYELRWVPVEAAKAVTTRGGFVIDL